MIYEKGDKLVQIYLSVFISNKNIDKQTGNEMSIKICKPILLGVNNLSERTFIHAATFADLTFHYPTTLTTTTHFTGTTTG